MLLFVYLILLINFVVIVNIMHSISIHLILPFPLFINVALFELLILCLIFYLLFNKLFTIVHKISILGHNQKSLITNKPDKSGK